MGEGGIWWRKEFVMPRAFYSQRKLIMPSATEVFDMSARINGAAAMKRRFRVAYFVSAEIEIVIK